MGFALYGAVEQGMFYAIMALGVYLSFRILHFPDLTVDGSFTTGAAIAAVLITAGVSPWLASLAAFGGGLIAGGITGVLHSKGNINPLLAGILTMTALYSINIRIMSGKANIPLLNEETFNVQLESFAATFIPGTKAGIVLIFAAASALLVKVLIDWFLKTEIGLAIRATGDNERMVRSFAANTDHAKITGLALSNGLVALSGAFIAQLDGFATSTMGIGLIIVGLASVIIGETVFGSKNIVISTFAVVAGSLVYWVVVNTAYQYGLKPYDTKLITTVLVIAALVLPRVSRTIREKQKRKQRLKDQAEKGEADHAAVE